MSDYQRDAHEIYPRKAYHCIVAPSTYAVVQSAQGIFYLVRLMQIGEIIRLESLVLDGRPVRSSNYDELLSFRQHIRSLRSHLSYIPWIPNQV
ncbi:MAG: hypothetical protein JO202_05870 [Ktedonobacteraceae bacterium]|nr:hypothetical protein [Ktedonobacteraceae bacterium]